MRVIKTTVSDEERERERVRLNQVSDPLKEIRISL